MARLNLSPPWVEFYHEVGAFFKYDEEVKIVYDDESKTVKLYVDNDAKAYALTQLLPPEKVYGNVTLNIEIVPANKAPANKLKSLKASTDMATLFKTALEDNPVLTQVETFDLFDNLITYVIFKKEVVQYWTDDLSDINGLRSTLYQEIAKEIFEEQDGVFFCTTNNLSSLLTIKI